MGDLGDDARYQGERTNTEAKGDRNLVRTEALWRLLGCGCCGRAHNGDNASGIRVSEPTPVVDNGARAPKNQAEESAKVGAVEFTNASGQGLEKLARDRRDVVNGSLEGALRNHKQTNVGVGDDSRGTRAVVEE